jgi:hypothetical protein
MSLSIYEQTSAQTSRDLRAITTLQAISSATHFQTENCSFEEKRSNWAVVWRAREGRAEVCWYIYKDIACKEKWWAPNIRS